VSLPSLAALLDPASRVTLKRFALRVALLGLFAVALSRQPAASFLGTIDLAAIITCACALFAGDAVGRGPLNQWDEALALLGLRCLMMGVLGR
jgi:hypothetical protein